MNIIFMCSADRGVQSVQKIISLLLPEDNLCVFTFKETPWEPPYVDRLAKLAEKNNVELKITTKVGSAKSLAYIKSFEPDIILLAGWRYMVPKAVYNISRIGTFVFHDSLLPAYRGFSPTVWAMVNGEDHTGVTLFKIVEKMDEGDILLQEKINIPFSSDIKEMTAIVTDTYLSIIQTAFTIFRSNEVKCWPQEHSQASYTCKRIPEDGCVSWADDSVEIYNLIRASTKPYSGAFTSFKREKLTIWSAEIFDDGLEYVGSVPGRVISILPSRGVVIATVSGRILIKLVSWKNQKNVTADTVIRAISDTLVRWN